MTPGGTAKGNRPIFDCFSAVKENSLYDRLRCCARPIDFFLLMRAIVLAASRKHEADATVLEDMAVVIS